MAQKIIFENEDMMKILSLYIDDNASVTVISKIYNVNDSVIKRILKENNIEIRGTNHYKNKYTFNEKFFKEIDTEDKAYWLGFIYADGYVTKEKILGIKISNTDYNHLEKFKNSIDSNHAINVYDCKHGYSNEENKYCQVELTSVENYLNLISLGVTPRKSKTLTFPSVVPNHLVKHFIRGYFDGDGSIYTSSTSVGVSFVGTEEFLNKLKENLPINSVAKINKYKNSDTYELKLGGGNIIRELYDFFYKDASVYLERKYEKFSNITEDLKTRKRKTTLTIEDVKAIKKCIQENMKQRDIARAFGVSESTISAIAKGRNHKEVTA